MRAATTTAYVYAVRCNFAAAEHEAAWNQWYSGPKLAEMLRKPHFLTVQRFAAAALDMRRKYLALWLVATPEAFATPEYRSDWGFFEWTPHIRDWSRDLYRSPLAADDPLFEIGPGDALYFAACDGMDAAAAREAVARASAKLPGVQWLEAVGLDRHAPLLGLKKIPRVERPAPLEAQAGLVETVFEPITARFAARGVPPAGAGR
jgi:hypothetical protein